MVIAYMAAVEHADRLQPCRRTTNKTRADADAATNELDLPRLFEIHAGIDQNLRWGTAIMDLMTTGEADDDSVREGADAACEYLREAKRNVDLLHDWWARSRRAH